jgi:16S rRNA (adenine1518-N6/adenine1519-N6)-dimethyltransferase
MSHKAKKSLGQNFLSSKRILGQMAESANLNKKDIVVEIGPGKGSLTTELLERASLVIAIEKDRDLIPVLKEKFAKEIKSKKLKLIEGDVLNESIIESLPKKYKVVANIPYYITGALFEKFLSNRNQPEVIVFMVQKEVAERVVAREKESILSLSVKAYGNPKYITKVSKKLFSPSPKVDSAIIAIYDISRKNFKNTKEEENFFKLIKLGFLHKRKVVLRNIEGVGDIEKIKEAFEESGINLKARAEDISFEKWLRLSKRIL